MHALPRASIARFSVLASFCLWEREVAIEEEEDEELLVMSSSINTFHADVISSGCLPEIGFCVWLVRENIVNSRGSLLKRRKTLPSLCGGQYLYVGNDSKLLTEDCGIISAWFDVSSEIWRNE